MESFSHTIHKDLTGTRISLLLKILLRSAQVIGNFMGSIHFYLTRNGIVNLDPLITGNFRSSLPVLRKIWKIRVLRRIISFLLRTPFRDRLISLVEIDLRLPQKSGVVICIPHSPYAKLLARWCLVNDFALVFAGGSWIKRTGHLNIRGEGFSPLRRLINHLKEGGNVVIIGDNLERFRCCKVSFLGKEREASMTPVRIAALAKVPVLATIPVLKKKRIAFRDPILIETSSSGENKRNATCSLLKYFEANFKKDPSLYPKFIFYTTRNIA